MQSASATRQEEGLRFRHERRHSMTSPAGKPRGADRGREEIYGQASGDRLYGSAGDDVLRGGGGPDQVWLSPDRTRICLCRPLEREPSSVLVGSVVGPFDLNPDHDDVLISWILE